ncbi:MAG: uracil-DNA glycosylase [Actinomycetota bacterium]
MLGQQGIRGFVERLGEFETGPNSRNFFSTALPANAARRNNILRYFEQMLERRPTVLLVGEAPGYRGMTVTGVPFTNKALISGNDPFGLFGAGNGYLLPPEVLTVPAEPTATVMWGVLAELDFLPLLWSAYPFHPHQPGRQLSNRTPSSAEIRAGLPLWRELARIFGIVTVVAVGNIGHRSVTAAGLSVPKVRHPAHGGKELFRQGLQDLLDAGVIRRSQ